ncbi:hypothetical protein Cni_G09112 [Canna indica]|uniref:ASCH domain-containing protein n=1 Tax=Canna indica TaxID=4628 RepID=A0AAQ3K1Q0_9LILI|nr:hypothetical protein Cni_G09112 [Canna indica]
MEGEVGTDEATGQRNSPPSPALAPIGLSDDLVEELIRFTLSLGTNGPPFSLALSLSPDYCSRLLQPEPSSLLPLDGCADACGGVPAYPLYKHLARAIRRCIESGSFSRSMCITMHSISLYEAAKLKESEWDNVILDKGSELTNMLKAVDFELHVQEPFFSQLRAGLKTVEGRCAIGDYNRIERGSLILCNKCLLLEVQHVNHYSSFSEMLQVETLAKVLPGVETIEHGVQIYRKFYTEEKEKSNGVLAISVSKSASQPYDALAELLSVLSYDGIASLLGMAHTIGTVADALPPPRSFLISSSTKPTRPNVTGCSLTDAARALAKHANRSSDGWWGVLSGSDFNKNRLALQMIYRLLNDCCWMNAHIIQPHGCVFEIRVLDGYGARWSHDGLKEDPFSPNSFGIGIRANNPQYQGQNTKFRNWIIMSTTHYGL